MQGLGSSPKTAALQLLHTTPLPSAWDHGKLQKKRPNLSILSSFREFQKLQLNLTNSGGFWLIRLSQNPNFLVAVPILRMRVWGFISLATIFAFGFVLCQACGATGRGADPAWTYVRTAQRIGVFPVITANNKKIPQKCWETWKGQWSREKERSKAFWVFLFLPLRNNALSGNPSL